MQNVLRMGAVRGFRGVLIAAVCLLPWQVAQAIDFTIPAPGSGDGIKGVLNTTFTAGVGVRMEGDSDNLIGKSNLNPNVCGGPNGADQICQGLFKDQIYPSQILAAAPGAASVNGDQGDLNYSKYHLFQAPAKVTSDLTLTWGNFGIFARALYFYDFVNADFTETHPNEITPQNRLQVGRHVAANTAALNPSSLLACVANAASGQVLSGVLCPVQNALINGRGYGQPDGNGDFVVYGPGGYVRSKRTNGEILAQAGASLQGLDSYFYGKLPIPFTEDKTVSFKIGRQLVNWGESTTLVINSLNQANPVNVNNVYRIGGQVEEYFTPINMVDISFEPLENATVEAFYQLEWQPIQVQTPGTYFSSLPIGTHNAGKTINASFGQAALDPDSIGTPQDNPLAGITNTTTTIGRLPDINARNSGQYGIKLDYYADNLNGGTDLSLYYMHYNSRLPYLSTFATYPSCARSAGNASHIDATDPATFFAVTCPDVPVLHSLLDAAQPESQYATSDTLGIDTAKFALEYPNNIDLLGLSFNTTVGSWSIQGEVAYRPDLPVQVDVHDLFFAAFGPTLTNCQNHSSGLLGTGCIGSHAGVGFTQNGGTTAYGPSDANILQPDTFDLAIGNIDGSARSFPNFIIPYRGGQTGENTPCYPQTGSAQDAAYGFNKFSHPYYAYNTSSPCYIRGYERMQAYEGNFGLTRVLGATDNPFGASQILILGEFGLEYVPFLPSLNKLALQGPNSSYGPTAGADGSGADGGPRSCAGSNECATGADGLRFNPHQQDPSGYPTALSYGYRVISQLRYESVLPSVNLRPFLVWKQDIGGISPGPGGNFVKGTKEFDSLMEVQYQQSLSFTLGYTWYWGGGIYNVLSDRDFAQFFVKYQF
jgi:hypothetical protein